ncbi:MULTISPECIES: MucR family transcriptional regulator [Sphingomonas]|uniref:MucR family transcriptional regulator n=1 Tax=Sphingomonas kyungheensis TaxID=1069987 RepID=A0ABU8H3F0_9SPHN|nr:MULTISPECIES: MucR family transcriptional regulator [unclassified Sphingomonas]EZP52239.1 ROS/MUCR transcriptional regulator family protein [Sphingomonas sp. RIT328]
MTTETNTVELATELTIAWLSNPNTRTTADDVPAFLQSMHAAVERLASPEAGDGDTASPEHVPAVSVRKSLASRDHIISMIDGKPYRTLRRHLTTHGLTPDDYRARYGLKSDYPMVAPSYSESRSAMAKTIGLGRKSGQKREDGTDAPKAPRKNAKAALQAAKDTLGTEE